MNADMLDALVQVGTSVISLVGVPFWIISGDGALLNSGADATPRTPFTTTVEEAICWILLISEGHKDEAIYVHENEFFERYVVVRLACEDTLEGLVVAGPTVARTHTKEELVRLLYERHIVGDQDVYLAHYRNLPVLPLDQLVEVGSLFHAAYYGKAADLGRVTVAYRAPLGVQQDEAVEEESRVYAKQYLQPSFDMAYENQLREAVVSGNHEAIEQAFGKLEAIDASKLHQHDALRSAKNKAIASVTLATRWAIEGGLDPIEAFTYSNSSIQLIETIADVRRVSPTIVSILSGFAKRVHNHQTSGWSAPVRDAVRFIRTHVFDNPTVPQIAAATGFSASYLTRIFTREVGISPQRYLLEAKVDEAKRMLRLTDYSLPEMAAMLGYTDQSHFTKRFREVTGTTPAAWRRENRQA